MERHVTSFAVEFTEPFIARVGSFILKSLGFHLQVLSVFDSDVFLQQAHVPEHLVALGALIGPVARVHPRVRLQSFLARKSDSAELTNVRFGRVGDRPALARHLFGPSGARWIIVSAGVATGHLLDKSDILVDVVVRLVERILGQLSVFNVLLGADVGFAASWSSRLLTSAALPATLVFLASQQVVFVELLVLHAIAFGRVRVYLQVRHQVALSHIACAAQVATVWPVRLVSDHVVHQVCLLAETTTAEVAGKRSGARVGVLVNWQRYLHIVVFQKIVMWYFCNWDLVSVEDKLNLSNVPFIFRLFLFIVKPVVISLLKMVTM